MPPEKEWIPRREQTARKLHTYGPLSIECREALTVWKAALIMLYVLVGIVCLFVAWRVMRHPFLGLLLMLAVNPLEGLFPLPHGLSAGRLVSVVTVVGWLAYLMRNTEVAKRLWQGQVLSRAWPFLAICSLGVVSNGASGASSYSYTVNLFLLAMMAVMVENLVDSRRKLYQLALVVALSSVVAAAFPLAYHFGVDLYSAFGVEAENTVYAGRAAGLSGNANAVGLACSMGLFALLILIVVERRVWVVLASSFLGMAMVGGLLLSGSRTHLVAVSVCAFMVGGLGLVGPKRGRQMTGLAAGVVIVLMLAAYVRAPENVQRRLVLVGNQVDERTRERQGFGALQRSHAMTLLADHPLIGIGLKNFRFPAGLDAHDTVSMLVGETGILGVFSFIWLVVPSWKSLYQGVKVGRRRGDLRLHLYAVGFMASFAAMFVAGIGGYIVPYQRWFWITLGAAGVLARWSEMASSHYGVQVKRPFAPDARRQWARRHPFRAPASRGSSRHGGIGF